MKLADPETVAKHDRVIRNRRTKQALIACFGWLRTAEWEHPKPKHPPTQPQSLNNIQYAIRLVTEAIEQIEADP